LDRHQPPLTRRHVVYYCSALYNSYLTIGAASTGDKLVEAILEYFRDKERREEFYAFFREIEELHEIISPDAFMRPFVKDYGKLADIYRVVRSNYDRGISPDKNLLRKTAALVQEHTHATGIAAPTRLQKLTPEALDAIASQNTPDTVKVFNLLKAIEQLGATEALREPYLISIADRAQQIAEAFEARQQTTEQALAALLKLYKEVGEARKERDAMKLSPESFAVYWLLKHDGVGQADAVAREAEQAFESCPHWQTSSHQEQELRKSFYKALISAGVDGVVDVAQRILNMLRRAGGGA
jgi:type I restriction enzyme R subunit